MSISGVSSSSSSSSSQVQSGNDALVPQGPTGGPGRLTHNQKQIDELNSLDSASGNPKHKIAEA